MVRSTRLAEKQANLQNEAQKEPNENKYRSKDKISNIALMDNDTMVEALKFLNYCQLAKNSLVSKKFNDVIQQHRHSLALLYVERIGVYSMTAVNAVIKIFDKELSFEAYNEWLIRNSYSQQVLIEDQVGSEQSTQNVSNVYQLVACAYYKDSNNQNLSDSTSVFFARVKLNDKNWPVFHHFVRLVTDPFIYINRMALTDQNAVLSSLSEAVNPNCRLQCKEFTFNLKNNGQKCITWTKNRMRCNQFYIYGETDLNKNEAFLDFFVTGALCTPLIRTSFRDHSKIIVDFMQKFMDLKNADEIHLIEAIEGNFWGQVENFIKRDYAELIVKEEIQDDDDRTEQMFEFVNNDIGKKLQLTVYISENIWSHFLIKISDL